MSEEFREIEIQMNQMETEMVKAISGVDQGDRLMQALQEVTKTFEIRLREMQTLESLKDAFNTDSFFDSLVISTCQFFQSTVPYDLFGFILFDHRGELLRSRWHSKESRSTEGNLFFDFLPLSLRFEGNILPSKCYAFSDLEIFREMYPAFDPIYRFIEGRMKSCLISPIRSNDRTIGILLFSGKFEHEYQEAHCELSERIACQLGTLIEKGRLYNKLVSLSELEKKYYSLWGAEVKTPVAEVRQALEATGVNAPKEVHDARQSIIREVNLTCNTMADLIDEMSDAAAIRDGRLALSPQLVDIFQFLASIVRTRRTDAEAKGITLWISDINPHLKFTLDPKRIKIVINKILAEAIDHAQKNSKIIVDGQLVDETLVVTIKSKQSSDDRTVSSSIFKRMAGVTGSKYASLPGLFFAKRILEYHTGRLFWELDQHNVSVFGFSLIPPQYPLS
jgi:signal transduction histidine kinase